MLCCCKFEIIQNVSQVFIILMKVKGGRLFHKSPEFLPLKSEKCFPLFVDFRLLCTIKEKHFRNNRFAGSLIQTQGKFVLQTIHCNNATLWLFLVFCASVRNRKQDTSFNQQVTIDTQMKGRLFIALLGLEQIYRGFKPIPCPPSLFYKSVI